MGYSESQKDGDMASTRGANTSNIRYFAKGRVDNIIIKACLNGNRGRDDNPNVPWTPQEVAEEAVRCHDAGAFSQSSHTEEESLVAVPNRFEGPWLSTAKRPLSQ